MTMTNYKAMTEDEIFQLIHARDMEIDRLKKEVKELNNDMDEISGKSIVRFRENSCLKHAIYDGLITAIENLGTMCSENGETVKTRYAGEVVAYLDIIEKCGLYDEYNRYFDATHNTKKASR